MPADGHQVFASRRHSNGLSAGGHSVSDRSNQMRLFNRRRAYGLPRIGDQMPADCHQVRRCQWRNSDKVPLGFHAMPSHADKVFASRWNADRLPRRGHEVSDRHDEMPGDTDPMSARANSVLGHSCCHDLPGGGHAMPANSDQVHRT